MFDPQNINHRVFSYYAPLKRVKRFVDQHYTEPLPLEMVAAVAGLEKTYFSTFFREKSGVCYRDWLSWVRIVHALELMKSRNIAITQAAFEVGFQDLRTFERAFEKCTGHTPQQMRKKLRPRLDVAS